MIFCGKIGICCDNWYTYFPELYYERILFNFCCSTFRCTERVLCRRKSAIVEVSPSYQPVWEQRGHEARRDRGNSYHGSYNRGEAINRSSRISGSENARDCKMFQGSSQEERHRPHCAVPDGIVPGPGGSYGVIEKKLELGMKTLVANAAQ